jgi:aspartyl protease family protein
MSPFLLAAVLAAGTIGLVLFLDQQFPGVLSSDDNQMDLVAKLVVLGALVGSLAVSFRRERLGSLARAALAWVVIGLVIVAGYSFRDELAPLWQRIAGNLVPAQAVSIAPGTVALRASSGGHFVALADVAAGGTAQRVRFMVDTGASDVVLTRDDAKRLGIDVERLRFDIPYSAANGTSMGARVRLDRVQIGDIAVDNVSGSVVSGRLEQSLLGMSFLRRLSGFEIRGDELILRR